MISLRRSQHETRIEIMPLIDVIFLLLTFFIYAMVLMIRAELMPMQLEQFAAADPARPAPALTISIRLDGSVYLDREPIELDAVLPRIQAAQAENPETRLYLAVEEGTGTTDRAPILTSLWDRLKDEGLEINFVGRPK